MTMWSALPLPWQVCVDEAWAAYCARTVPVGAAVVDGAGAIRARGRNQLVDAGSGRGPIRNHDLAHAELNALLGCPSADVDAAFALYTTLEPCPLCLGAFYMSRIRRLHYAARDPLAGSANLIGASPYLARKPIRVFAPDIAALEALSIVLHTEYAIAVRGPHAPAFVAPWRGILPDAVAVGEALAHSGELRAMRDAAWPAARMADALAPRLVR
jgi:tRNA(adenine34) deaminase